MSSSTVRISSGDRDLLAVGVTDAVASLAALSCFRFSRLCAERISALTKAAHMSSDHDLQVLQGVAREHTMPTLYKIYMMGDHPTLPTDGREPSVIPWRAFTKHGFLHYFLLFKPE